MPQSASNLSTLQALLATIESRLTQSGRSVIAIDGRCGGGKSTLAALLAERFNGAVIPADDFFLRPEQRTPRRFAQPGGNMDRERLTEEVLLPLSRGEAIAYRPFDCSTLSLGAPVTIDASSLIIVEGSYSCHPDLWDYYDLHVFVDVDPDVQIARIVAREGATKAETFKARWIPLEEKYFSHFQIQEKCELVIR